MENDGFENDNTSVSVDFGCLSTTKAVSICRFVPLQKRLRSICQRIRCHPNVFHLDDDELSNLKWFVEAGLTIPKRVVLASERELCRWMTLLRATTSLEMIKRRPRITESSQTFISETDIHTNC